MAALPILLGVLSGVVFLAILIVAAHIPAFAQDERDHRELASTEAHPANDNLGALSVTERTMMGFAVALVGVIATFAYLTFGGVA